MKQLIVGMPASGKSTYIGALRHILVARQVETDLALDMLADDERHLNTLEDKWLSCEMMDRTNPSDEGWVELKVMDRISGATTVMTMPDLRGENFEQPVVSGRCSRDLYEALASSDGILLFTNVDRADDMLLIDDFSDMTDDEESSADLADARASAGSSDDGAVLEEEKGKFRPQDMGEEVKIVEFLQMANRRPLFPKRRKIALLASAWDVVLANETEVTPEAWLANKRPMLNQFLKYNDDLWELRIYGVSAQGGALPARKDEFMQMRNPSERIRVVGHGAGQHDLTAPLRWLMGVG